MRANLLKLSALSLAAVLATFEQSASAGTYTYHDQKYRDAASLLAAHRLDLAAQVAAVPVAAAPIAGRAVVVLPDRDRLRPLVRTILSSKGVPSDEAVKVAVEFERQALRAVSDSVIRSRLFKSVSVIERNDTQQPAVSDYDYLLVFQVKPKVATNMSGPWIGGWVLQKHGSAPQIYITADPGVAPIQNKVSFVENLRQNTLKLETVRDGAPASVDAAAGTAARRATGTGIIITKEGAIVTNAHVVQGCASVHVLDGGEGMAASVRAQDGPNDLALLKVQHEWSMAAQFRDGPAIRQGDNVVVLGYPLTGVLATNTNLTTGSVSALAGIGDDTRLLQISAPVQAGNSGGPLLDMGGHLVGVVSSKLNALAIARFTGDIPQNVNFAIKAAIVRNFLDANGVSYTTSPTQQTLSAADVGDRARNFTVLVECLR